LRLPGICITNSILQQSSSFQPVTVRHKTPQSQQMLPDDEKLYAPASVLTAQNAQYVVECIECRKPRVIYSKPALSSRQRLLLSMLLSEHDYTCGSPVTIPSSALHGKAFVRLSLTCDDSVELPYYSSKVGRLDICAHCGNPEATVNQSLKKDYKTVLPVCDPCIAIGLKPICSRPRLPKAPKH
jgi:hypothetical protein